jgi:polar amino acid transport system substrate-binding protein
MESPHRPSLLRLGKWEEAEMKKFGKKARACARAVLTLSLLGVAAFAYAQEVPAAGSSPRIDEIRKAGVLRVAVMTNAPWLIENTTGGAEPWSGPAWILAKEYAKRLGVKLQTVPVSHETKVPVLAANQADLSITALAETPERLKVVDFVIYSQTSVCMFGKAANPKIANAKTMDDLNDPSVTIAFLTGSAEENWVKQRFPKAKLRGVGGTSVAPVEEIMAGRADAVPINRIPYIPLSRKVKGLDSIPHENHCQGSTEKTSPVGLALDKNQPAFLDWLRAVAKTMQPQLDKAEADIVNTME